MTQTRSVPHAFPHEPQLLLSLLRSRQVLPPQVAVPLGHAQVPPAQTIPDFVQSFPQLPQLLSSVFVLTHALPHSVVPAPQTHWPLEHTMPGPQTVEQLPQWYESLERSAHVPLQLVRLPGQVELHLPLTQTLPAAQAAPQAPQLSGSLVTLTQRWPQCVVPLGQLPLHTPPTQTIPAPQALLHLPQLCGSLPRSVQVPLHLTWPPSQFWPLLVHVPLMQDWPAAQVTPQAPQWFGSEPTLTQAPLQLVEPDGHRLEQVPFAQTWPGPQALPHRPQFWASLASATHDPEQAVVPLGQWLWQTPCPHTCPGLHAWPQRPQLRTSLATLTHLPLQLVVCARQPQPFVAGLPFLWGSVMQVCPLGQHLPLQYARWLGQWPVAAANASVGVIATTPANAAPPARSASRRDMPSANPRAIVSSALAPASFLRKRRSIIVGTLRLRVPRVGGYTW